MYEIDTGREECEYCSINYVESDVCSSINDGVSCTRPDGHDGPHVACRRSDHDYERWANESDTDDGSVADRLRDIEQQSRPQIRNPDGKR